MVSFGFCEQEFCLYCRFCKIPAIRAAIHKQYPNAVPWGPSNTTQHAAFQCLWVQYDHIIPHARGGQSTLENMVLTCAACNYGRGNHLLEDFNLTHPNLHPPRTGPWDGLTRFRYRAPPGRGSRNVSAPQAGRQSNIRRAQSPPMLHAPNPTRAPP